MITKNFLTLIFFLLLLFRPSLLWADTVILKEEGTIFHGKIIQKDQVRIWLEVDKGVLIFKKTDVDFKYNLEKAQKTLSGIHGVEVRNVDESKETPKNKLESIEEKSPVNALAKNVKKEVSSWEMGQIQRWVTEVHRIRMRDRQKAMGLLTMYAQKYPETVSKLALGYLNHPNYLVRMNFCRILGSAGYMDKEVIEGLLQKLSDENQKVRCEAAQSLKQITGEAISLPIPESVDYSPQMILTEREKDVIKQWDEWWKKYQEKIEKAKKEEELKKEIYQLLKNFNN